MFLYQTSLKLNPNKLTLALAVVCNGNRLASLAGCLSYVADRGVGQSINSTDKFGLLLALSSVQRSRVDAFPLQTIDAVWDHVLVYQAPLIPWAGQA